MPYTPEDEAARINAAADIVGDGGAPSPNAPTIRMVSDKTDEVFGIGSRKVAGAIGNAVDANRIASVAKRGGNFLMFGLIAGAGTAALAINRMGRPKARNHSPAAMAQQHIQATPPAMVPAVGKLGLMGQNYHITGTIDDRDVARQVSDMFEGGSALMDLSSRRSPESILGRLSGRSY